MRRRGTVFSAEVALVLQILPMVVWYGVRGFVVRRVHHRSVRWSTVVTRCLRVGYCVGSFTLTVALASGAASWRETGRPV